MKVATSKLIVERWVPVMEDMVRLPVEQTEVVSYPGEEAAVLWVVVLRDGSVPEGKRLRTEHVKPIRVIS